MRTGIYQIRNLINGKRYIGSVAERRGWKHRWEKHRRTLREDIHHSHHLQHAWNKHDESSFVFEILEECLPEQCIEREQHYLDIVLFASSNDSRFDKLGYNICRIAGIGNRLGVKHTKESKLKMSIARKGRPLSKQHRKNLSGNKNHFYGKQHTEETKKQLARAHAKLSKQDVEQIRRMIQKGFLQKDIANQYGVTQATISKINCGKTRYYD